MRGGAGADGGGQRDTGDDGRCDACVGKCGKESGECLDTDVAQRREALDGDQRAAGQRDETDDRNRAADDSHRAGAHADLGDESQRLLAGSGAVPTRSPRRLMRVNLAKIPSARIFGPCRRRSG